MSDATYVALDWITVLLLGCWLGSGFDRRWRVALEGLGGLLALGVLLGTFGDRRLLDGLLIRGILMVPLVLAIAALVGVGYLLFGTRGTPAKLHRAPGWTLYRLASFLFSDRTFARVFQPALSDLERDYVQALAAGKPAKARWTLVRNYWAFWQAFAAQLPVSLIRVIGALWKAVVG